MPSVVLVVGWYCLTNRWNQRSFELLLRAPNSTHNSKIVLWHILCIIFWISNWHLRSNYVLPHWNIFQRFLFLCALLGKCFRKKKKWSRANVRHRKTSDTLVPVLKSVMLKTMSESWTLDKYGAMLARQKTQSSLQRGKTDQLEYN